MFSVFRRLPVDGMVTAICLLLAGTGAAQALTESHYTEQWCESMGGQSEVTMPDGTRADCVTEDYAVEVERAKNWLEAPGQALWYAFQTNKRAGIVLIVGEGEDTYLQRLYSLIRHYDLPVRVWVVEQ